ncbi:hypothetical protein [Flavobacterium sp. LC2016-01]|uniref:GAP1-N1 domain-containing protein n=1 Tax=Flavobacterium sp. LC2016-01 TaxID=2675876 RepID=UPI0012BA8E59|nr:hypothetical protein [Flavobacterium sp. LC2016-01]MTH15874.1 hypothetical protein [Flavobacterium sp. LC2016-01]
MDKVGAIKIQQTLHGYKNGHTLLASSVELDSDLKRIMLPISDMSGSSMVIGFESYITGYPLKDSNLYAIARTWYAPEMKRPGCVYTHTLLIDFTDLPKINDIFQIMSFFKRPSLEKVQLSKYEKILNYLPNEVFIDKSVILRSENLIKSVLLELYSDPKNSIFIKGDKMHSDYEVIFLLIWRQQWPRLRRNFSFCTGAISPRNFQGELLNLQAVSSKIDITHSGSKNIVVIDSRSLEIRLRPDWVDFAFENLLNTSSNLISYFNFFGSDLSASRSTFKLLTETYLFFIKLKPSITDSIEYFSKNFPSIKEGRSLKSAIFGANMSSFSNFLPHYTEEAFLYYFSISDYYETFDYMKLDFNNRFCSYCLSLNEKAIQLLQKLILQDLNQHGESAINDLAHKLDHNENLTGIWANDNLSYLFLNLNPNFAYGIDFWIGQNKTHAEIVASLQKLNVDTNIDWQIIINNLIEINSPVDPRIFSSNFEIEDLILNALNSSKQVKLGRNWLELLTVKGSIKWFKAQKDVNDSVIEILIYVFNPNLRELVNVGFVHWLKYIERAQMQKQKSISIDVKSFLLALAFNNNGIQSKILFEVSFEEVYDKLAQDNLNFVSWHHIESHTKSLGIFKNWDKCKKLINAVVDCYIANKWEINSLLNNIEKNELRERTLIQYKRRK